MRQPIKRKGLSDAAKARIIARQDGRCAHCHEKFKAGDRIEFDHGHDLWLDGPDTEENQFAKHDDCHLVHTKRSARDRAHIARIIRKREGTWKVTRHKIPKRANPWPESSRPIPARANPWRR